MTWNPLVNAADKSAPARPLAGGSGGEIPPIDTRPYKDPGGDDSNKGNGPKKGNTLANGIKFKSVFGRDKDGRTIYYEGLLDSQGRLRVFKYPSTGGETFVSRGYVENNPASPDYQNTKWPGWSGDRVENIEKEIAQLQGEIPVENVKAPLDTSAPRQLHRTNDSPPESALFGDQFGVDSDGRNVMFEGSRQAQGQYRVYKSTSSKLSFVRQGILTFDGKTPHIAWDKADVRFEELVAKYGPSSGSPVAGQTSPDGDPVMYEGGKDSSGRLKVFSIRRGGEGREWGAFYGAQEADGRITWSTNGKPFPAAEEFVLPGPNDKVAWRPSNLEKFVQDVKNSDGKIPFKTNEKVAGVGIGLGAFYVGLGMVAAYQLMRDYPNNPVAWEQYVKSLTDPVGLLMAAGFMAAAYPFMSKVGGFTSGKSVIRSVPAFAAGLAAGTLITGLIYYGSNPDVRKCIGLNDFPKVHARDIAACDRAYDQLSMESVTLTFVPAFTNLLAAGGIYMGMSYFTTVTGLSTWLRTLPVLKGRAGNAIFLVAGAVVFLASYQIASDVFEVEKKTREKLIADFSLSGNLYGGSIGTAQENLYNRWSALKSNGFRDQPSAAKEVRSAWINPNCSEWAGTCPKPKPVDFSGTLNRYSDLQNLWRNVQMGRTMDAYKHWMQRVSGYHLTLNAAFYTYQDFINRIALEQSDTQVPVTEMDRFNTKVYQDMVKESKARNDVFSPQDTNGVWTYVATPHFYDFVVASMACGPEAEGYTAGGGVLTSISNMVSDYVTGYSTPPHLIENNVGKSIKFYPPRIVNRVVGDDTSVCVKSPTPHIWNPGDLIAPPLAFTPDQFRVRQGWFRYTTDPNLIDFVKKEIRPTVLEGKRSHFGTWWNKTISPQVMKVEAQIRNEYQDLLDQTYKPTVTRSDYHWCDISQSADPTLTRYMTVLYDGVTPDCAAGALHRLGYGVWNSLSDEAALYISMMLDAEIAGLAGGDTTRQKQMEDILLPMGRDVLTSFRDLNAILANTHPGTRATPNIVSDQMGNRFVALQDKIDELGKDAPAAPYRSWVLYLSQHVQQTLESSANYYAILTSFDVDGVNP